jgi:xanthine/CO dehydrogenase XdhC/CoxF family maturation factor
MPELAAIADALGEASNLPAVLATLVRVEGSSYRRPGARLLLPADGRRIGAISGGCLEADLVERARGVRARGVAEVVTYDTTAENDLVWGVGLGCHGVVRVLLERIDAVPAWATELPSAWAGGRLLTLGVRHEGPDPQRWGTRLLGGDAAGGEPGEWVQRVKPPPALYVLGAGDDAPPLVALAATLGWHVTVADPRPAFATRERFPGATRVLAAPPEQLIPLLNPGPDALVVVMTHHYVHDLPLLGALLGRPLAYVGLLGPRRRAARILADLAATAPAAAAELGRRLHAPVGLDLGADGPEQVALAIVAEMQAVLGGRDGRPLREREGPIHD